MMKTEELDYNLPSELIAQRPLAERDKARLLVVDRKLSSFEDRFFYDIVEYLRAGDVLVLNDSRVIPARLFFKKPTGGEVEGLFIKALSDDSWEVMIKGISRLKEGLVLTIPGEDTRFLFEKRLSDKTALIRLSRSQEPLEFLERVGQMPLPPYIRRKKADDELKRLDKEMYQTVFGKKIGSIAAPTAGLHFTESLLERIKNIGVKIAYVTLHVGLGTFEPIAEENIEDHKMHSELYSIDDKTAELIMQTKKGGGRVFAVGTTSVRVLESAATKEGELSAGSRSTDLYIYPPYKFKIVDSLITNFHLPRSTLLALVYAFGGVELIKRAYQHAIDNRYRFYSYGDAMLIL